MVKYNMIRFLTLSSLIAFSFGSNAQESFGYYQDALRFSQTSTSIGASARIKAIGGAQTALGGDLSSIVSNPAGLGFFNQSTFALTPSLDFISTETEYISKLEESMKANFNFSNIGAVFHFGKSPYTTDKFKGGTLGISLNKMNTYHLDRSYFAPNDFNSIVDSFLQNAGNSSINDLGDLEYEAYNQYLINPIVNDDDEVLEYETYIGFPIQSETINQRGSHYQLNVAWGGNMDDQWYFGGGMGVQVINYKQERDFIENDFVEFDDTGEAFVDDLINYISLSDELHLNGYGINFNVGTIFRPVHFITLGISYTSPSFLSFDEEYSFNLATNWKEGAAFVAIDEEGNETITDISGTFYSPDYLYLTDYNLQTPSKLAAGAAFFVGKGGFLSVDVERVDYSKAVIRTSDFIEAGDNTLIEKQYKETLNLRVGGEYRFDPLRLRAGYAVLPSPYRDSNLQEKTNLTFGMGYNKRNYFFDIAVTNSQTALLYIPYEVNFNQPIAESKVEATSISITFGLNF